MLRSWLEELREAEELLPLSAAALLAVLPERTALELELEEEPLLRVVVPLLRVELLELEELPLRVLEPLWLLRVLEPLWALEPELREVLPLCAEEELLPLLRLELELAELELPLLRVLPLCAEEELLPLLRVLPLWALELPLLRVLPLWLLRVEDEEVLADCLEELLLRVALLVEVLPEERVDEEEDEVVERLLLPELRLCANASTLNRSMRATALAAES